LLVARALARVLFYLFSINYQSRAKARGTASRFFFILQKIKKSCIFAKYINHKKNRNGKNNY